MYGEWSGLAHGLCVCVCVCRNDEADEKRWDGINEDLMLPESAMCHLLTKFSYNDLVSKESH